MVTHIFFTTLNTIPITLWRYIGVFWSVLMSVNAMCFAFLNHAASAAQFFASAFIACLAISLTIYPIDIFFNKFVSIDAMSFTSILGWRTYASQFVGCGRNRFNMYWIDTRRNSAQVVAFQRWTHRLNQQMINKSVGRIIYTIKSNLTVTPRLFRIPQPTRRFISRILDGNVRKNLREQFTRNDNTVIISGRHGVYSFLVNSVNRAVSEIASLSRPVFIVT